MKLTSSSFQNNQSLPESCAYRGKNLSPKLTIENVPGETKSLALVVDDPDAPVGNWNHWLVWNIAPSTTHIDEGKIPAAATIGRNDFGNNQFDGPAPPSGTHRYFFKLFALNKTLDLQTGASREQLLAAMKDAVIAEAELIGTFAAKR
ncbi:MAG: YbhB/YbcL family Raf kinase inhibitor-like protein [Verrucomicrobiota bacterium]